MSTPSNSCNREWIFKILGPTSFCALFVIIFPCLDTSHDCEIFVWVEKYRNQFNRHWISNWFDQCLYFFSIWILSSVFILIELVFSFFCLARFCRVAKDKKHNKLNCVIRCFYGNSRHSVATNNNFFLRKTWLWTLIMEWNPRASWYLKVFVLGFFGLYWFVWLLGCIKTNH